MAVRIFKFTACFFSFFLISGFLFSCSNVAQDSVDADETPTLRYTAESLYASTIWTEEVEVDRLTAKVSSVNGISSRLNLSPLIVAASIPAENSSVFPTLGSFGSLDTTLISKSLRDMLSSFSDSISKYNDADSFFQKENLYSLALFYNDFHRIFGEVFELDKVEEPVQKPVEQKKDEQKDGQQKDEQSSEDSEPELPPQKSYFTSFIFGQPFLDGIYYEVPVKFFSDKANLTVCVFCYETSNDWKIDQIQITDWEIFDGKK